MIFRDLKFFGKNQGCILQKFCKKKYLLIKETADTVKQVIEQIPVDQKRKFITDANHYVLRIFLLVIILLFEGRIDYQLQYRDYPTP